MWYTEVRYPEDRNDIISNIPYTGLLYTTDSVSSALAITPQTVVKHEASEVPEGNAEFWRITNTPAGDATVSLKVTKLWDPGELGGNEVYEELSVKIKLLDDGEESGLEADLSLRNSWTYTFTGLPKFDEKGEEIKIEAKPGSKDFEDYWKPFLIDFSKHLKEKGWLGRTYISMDERSVEDMRAISAFVKKHAPELKISTAGNFDPSKYPELKIDNYCPVIDKVTTKFISNNVETRRNSGMLTTYYVCCVPRKPNTFMESGLEESFWCGFFPAAKNLDGFLRWAYNSWPYDPRNDASFGPFRAGDTFLVYPDNQHSCRFLELRNGIQAAEKFRILKESASKGLRAEMDALSAEYDYFAARKEKADLKPLKDKTLELVNRDTLK
jgi:hypothetical protein